MTDDRVTLLARIEALEKENAALLLLLEKHGIVRNKLHSVVCGRIDFMKRRVQFSGNKHGVEENRSFTLEMRKRIRENSPHMKTFPTFSLKKSLCGLCSVLPSGSFLI